MCVVRGTGTGPIGAKEPNKILYKIHGIILTQNISFSEWKFFSIRQPRKRREKKHENLFFPSKLFHYEFCITKCRYAVWQERKKKKRRYPKENNFSERNLMFDFKWCLSIMKSSTLFNKLSISAGEKQWI